ncbi:hypothetical protein Moror_639 [Moniliophthora roreri MCA 2997]|uniref:Uncharacterized protein n=1 Tax=Moniliophthora roreri (strain MCA 2997) TaxID=1381753 RepID=V2WWY7_MONRO|nr:hypothetical protein Moror_639 [Moniliophthora roreri MCA 2997]
MTTPASPTTPGRFISTLKAKCAGQHPERASGPHGEIVPTFGYELLEELTRWRTQDDCDKSAGPPEDQEL